MSPEYVSDLLVVGDNILRPHVYARTTGWLKHQRWRPDIHIDGLEMRLVALDLCRENAAFS